MIAHRRRVLPENAHLALNGFVIHLALPALILSQVPVFLKTQSLSASLLFLGLMPWIGFVLAWALVGRFSKLMGFSEDARIAITIAVGLGNTAFVGFPILEALLGSEALPYGIILDQLGTFLVLTVVGVSYLAFHQERRDVSPIKLSSKRVHIGAVFKRIFKFTPFLALLVSFVMVLFEIPDTVQKGFERLGSCLVPAALFSVGFQARFDSGVFKKWGKELSFGLGLKLILWPLLFGGVYRFIFEPSSLEYQTLVLQSAMAPMITSLLLTIEAGFAAELCALFLGVGIPLSFLTTWVWSKWIS